MYPPAPSGMRTTLVGCAALSIGLSLKLILSGARKMNARINVTITSYCQLPRSWFHQKRFLNVVQTLVITIYSRCWLLSVTAYCVANLGDTLHAHIRPQRFGNNHTPVGLLVILDDLQPRAADRQAAAVQCMHELGFSFAIGAEPNVSAPRLESFEIRTRRNLAEQLLPRQPDFNVVRLGGRETHVSRTQHDDPIVQSEPLQYRFSVVRELLVLFVGFVRARELHQLHFLKLVLADDATHVLAVGTGFAAETWSVRGERDGQPRAIEHFVAVEIRDRHFRSRDQPQVRPLALEGIAGEFRQLSGTVHGIGVHEVRREDLGISVLARVQVEHEVGESAFELRTQVPIDREARAGKLGGTLEIQNAQLLT